MKTARVLLTMAVLTGCSSSENAQPVADASTTVPDVVVGEVGEVGEDATPVTDSRPAEDSGSDAGGAPGFCTTETPTIVASGAGLKATTAHYELYAETTEAEALDLARLLEASSLAFASWFERPVPSERMKVKFYKDHTAWEAGITADGLTAPTGAGGYFSPTTKTAYSYKQGNPYYSHVLTVHEATHQYQRLTRLTVPAPPFWYVEGIAEYLSRHDWDGSCVKLGVTSLLSWEDLPAAAKGSPIDVAAVIDGTKSATRAESWAIVRYLDTGAMQAGFKAYRDAFDANTSPSFSSLVAPPASLSAPLASWLPTAQEPMKPIFTEWIHVGPRAVNVDTPTYFSLALVKESPVTHFEAKLRIPSSGKYNAGVIVSYTDNTHYIGVVHGNDGRVSTFTASGSATWGNLGSAPKPSGAFESFAVDFSSGTAKVTFEGTSFSVPVTSPRVGLAASDTTASFYDVTWTP